MGNDLVIAYYGHISKPERIRSSADIGARAVDGIYKVFGIITGGLRRLPTLPTSSVLQRVGSGEQFVGQAGVEKPAWGEKALCCPAAQVAPTS